MDDRIAFLRVRLDEASEAAYASLEPPPGYRPRPETHPDVVAARFVLADVDAKRKIIDEAGSTVSTHKLCNRCVTCRSVRLLALPYAGHPDYREEWRP